MNKPAMSDTQDDLKEAQDELAGLIFQCARYERPSMDWKEALAEYTELCRAHFAKQDAEPSIQLELPKSWHFKCRRCGSEQNGEFQYARTPITSENCVPRINELLSDCVEVLGAFPESKGRLHDALVTSIINYLLPPAKEAPPIPADTFQHRVWPWMMACFGAEISGDKQERNHRFIEESLELVQSTGCTESEAHQLVAYVYGRPTGEPIQEVGGVMVTLAALCLAQNINMHDAGETELARIWTKIEQIRAKQAAKPRNSPLASASAQPIPPDPKPVRFDLDENAAENLRDFIGDEEAMAVTLSVGHIKDEETGVVEYGLRATAADYPEEGSIMLVPMPLPAAPTPPDPVTLPRDLMNELEWGSSNFDRYGVTQRYCPICEEQREDGHAADCDLAKAMIAAAPKEGV